MELFGGQRSAPVSTHAFVSDSPHRDSGAVPGVKESLVRDDNRLLAA
jgi:hypothetical protein